MLTVRANTWYVFGFVVVHTEGGEHRLAGLYSAILKESPDRVSVFPEFAKAVQTSSIIKFLDVKTYSHFRSLSIQLEQFLKTPPKQNNELLST